MRVLNAGARTFANLNILAAQYNVTDDGCGEFTFARCVASKAPSARAFFAMKVNPKKLATKRP